MSQRTVQNCFQKSKNLLRGEEKKKLKWQFQQINSLIKKLNTTTNTPNDENDKTVGKFTLAYH